MFPINAICRIRPKNPICWLINDNLSSIFSLEFSQKIIERNVKRWTVEVKTKEQGKQKNENRSGILWLSGLTLMVAVFSAP